MKKLLSLLVTLALVLSMGACGEKEDSDPASAGFGQNVRESADREDSGSEENPAEENSSEGNPSDESSREPAHYPVTLTDQAGRAVTIAEEPEKLVSGYYISTSLLIALNLEEKIVGIEAKADKRAIYRLSAPELTRLPNVGSAKEFDLEGCAALEPDLVILPLKLRNAADTLEELGISVLLVNPKVYLAGNSSMLSTAGDAMYQSDLIRLAGGVNAAAEITDTYWVEISYEQLLAWDPEYIILASDAAYSAEDVLADPNLAACDAVLNGQVYQMPNRAEAWDSPVPGGILGAVWLAGILHPDLYPPAACHEVIDEYYETFYGFVYSEN